MKDRIESFYNHLSLKKKIVTLTIIIIVFLVILLTSLNYSWYTKRFMNQTLLQNQQIIEQTAMNIDTYFEEMSRLTLAPYYNDEVMGLLESGSANEVEALNKKRTIENFLSSVMILPRSEILRVYILTNTDIYSYTRTPYDMEQYSTYLSTDWYQHALTTPKSTLLPVSSEKVFGEKKLPLFSIVRGLRSKENNDNFVGVIKVDADYSAIQSICDKVNFKGKGSLFLIGDNGDIIYKNDTLGLEPLIPLIRFENSGGDSFLTKIEGEKYMVNRTPLSFEGASLIAINSYDALRQNNLQIRNTTVFIAFLCLLLSIALLIIFTSNFFKPLNSIVASMKKIQNGNLDLRLPIVHYDEIGYLTHSFNNMLIHIKRMMESNTLLLKQVYETRYLQQEAQYHALCNQIKPHFLYNTLNTISILIKCNRKEDAIRSIENLSSFLRGIMNIPKTIPLREEIAIVNTYLLLQTQKYGDSLTYEIDIEKDGAGLFIPSLLLQPIVENSIIHGCEEKRGKNHIMIRGRKQGKNFVITVEDDGCGIAPDKLNMLNLQLSHTAFLTLSANNDTPLSSDHREEKPGIGLSNIAKRLYLRFGSESSIRIESVLNVKTTVTVTFPFNAAQKEESYVQSSDC